MPHQVSFSKAAYAALKSRKRPGDSFSDVVLRLVQEAEPKKDPFAGFGRGRIKDAEAHLRYVEELRDMELL